LGAGVSALGLGLLATGAKGACEAHPTNAKATLTPINRRRTSRLAFTTEGLLQLLIIQTVLQTNAKKSDCPGCRNPA
jgi:hypothetical protein